MLASTSASLNLNVMMQELLLQHAGFIYYASAALHLSYKKERRVCNREENDKEAVSSDMDR